MGLLHALAAAYLAAVPEEPIFWGETVGPNDVGNVLRLYEQTASRPGGLVMAAVDGVRPIGYAVCECYADPQSHTTVAMLHHVFLLPEYRRRGIVEQGMEYIRTWAFGCGATHLGVISRRRGSMMRWMGFQFSGYYRGMEYLTCPIVRPEGATHVSFS